VHRSPRIRKVAVPRWKHSWRLGLRARSAHHPSVTALKRDLRRLHLHTVCESARCPNLHECFHRGTATFLILGDRCTRGCGFCSVARESPLALDPDEPANVARMAARMGLRYVVVTSVTRDDLADGGSAHFAETVRRVRQALPEAGVEVLTPDFGGDLHAVARVADSGPEVFNHNLETVERLYHRVRPRADYLRSLELLGFAKRRRPEAWTKSGLMVGLGETPAEVQAALGDLRRADVDIVTIGQYLQPARRNLPVAEYVPPGQFETYRRYALSLGFPTVFSGPLVRSSYMADQLAGDPAC
jgi:lipoic acid synthetase